MPKVNKIVQSFNAGELSPLMDSRIDQDKYKFGCRIMENFYPLIFGAAKRRPGTEYIATQKSSSAKGMVVAFEHSVDDVYMLCFENQVLRFFKSGDRVRTSGSVDTLSLVNSTYKWTASGSGTAEFYVELTGGGDPSIGTVQVVTEDGSDMTSGTLGSLSVTEYGYGDNDSLGYDTVYVRLTDGADPDSKADDFVIANFIYEIVTPYLTADLLSLDIKQSADVMFITHGSYEGRKLSRTGDTSWTLVVSAFADGPFRTENTTIAATIVANGTTGSVTLTAVGHTPFVLGTTAGHSPSGSVATSKSQTGALFKLIHATGTPSVGESLDSTMVDATTTALVVPKGVTWDFTTTGTWGTGGPSTIVLERSYDNFTTKETLVTVTSLANYNRVTSGTEEFADAKIRARVTDGAGTGTASIQISIRDTSHIGIVKITAVASTTSATATVLTTLGSTDKTHRWSEGAWSNYRGWPKTVGISPEERLTFAGSASKPLTVWGSIVGDFTSMKTGTLDDDAIIFTLIGSGQQNTIQWMVPNASMMIGALGGEHLLGGSNLEEALTPTNVTAKLKTTYGSEIPAAFLINQAIIFLQRGGRQIRELSNLNTLNTNDMSSWRADDLTVFSEHIAGDGGNITTMAFQRTPTPMLWCIRSDGQIAVMVYERSQNVFSWCRFVTDGEYESVAVMYGGSASEDEVWVTVKRVINGSTVRYVERFANQNYEQLDETMMVDSAKIVLSTAPSGNINLASDTVTCGAGICGSSFCGGNYAG
ncbi:hypothetical protein LCGC14_0434480 [marine sediment metagenome]|uniref:Ubiquitin-activating enzyme E1 FCCH domain-containing protein n=1 Tax=marine sediment metagenome TaxID=412755 RepID=A0A0F9VWK4_9ZZZZ